MDIKKLPPSMLVALGLAGCGPTVAGEDDDGMDGSASASNTSPTEATTTACLDVDPTIPPGTTTTGPCLGMEQTEVGPCLDGNWSTGPCLEVAGSSGGSESGSDSSAGSTGTTGTTGAGTTSVGDTIGPCLAPPGEPDAPPEPDGELHSDAAGVRAKVLEGILDRGVLPADVAAKLKG